MATVTSFFADNLIQFARTLRAAGLRLGPSMVLDALAAMQHIDLSRRDQVRAGLRSVLVHRSEDLDLFEQAFALFFDGTKPLSADSEPLVKKSAANRSGDPLLRRVTEALFGSASRPPPQGPPPDEIDCALTWSADRALRHRDFADMTTEELREAQRIIANLRFAVTPRPTRRTQPSSLSLIHISEPTRPY